jgi:hypothetical protein
MGVSAKMLSKGDLVLERIVIQWASKTTSRLGEGFEASHQVSAGAANSNWIEGDGKVLVATGSNELSSCFGFLGHHVGVL